MESVSNNKYRYYVKVIKIYNYKEISALPKFNTIINNKKVSKHLIFNILLGHMFFFLLILFLERSNK